MRLSSTRSRLRTTVVAIASVALLSGGVAVATAPAASADTTATFTATDARWGIKQTFRDYVAEELYSAPGFITEGRASIVPSNGASFNGGTLSTRTPQINKSPFKWPAGTSASTYDAATGTGIVELGGKVNFAYPRHYIYSMAFSNPTIQFTGGGNGTISLETAYDLYDDEAKETRATTRAAFATFTGALRSTSSTTCGTSHTFVIEPTLTAEGAVAFHDFYAAGAALDSMSIVISDNRVCATSIQATASPTVVNYGKARSINVTVNSPVGAPAATGSVQVIYKGNAIATKVLTSGKASIALPTTQAVWRRTYTVKYLGTPTHAASEATVTQSVIKANTTTKLVVASNQVTAIKAGRNGWATVQVWASGVKPSGAVVVKDGTKVIATGSARNGVASVKLPILGKGTHKLRAFFSTTSAFNYSASGIVTIVR